MVPAPQLGSDWPGGNDQQPGLASLHIYTGQGSSRTSHWRDLHSAVSVEFSNLHRAELPIPAVANSVTFMLRTSNTLAIS